MTVEIRTRGHVGPIREGLQRWFGKITDEEIRRGSYGSVKDLIESIDLYLKNYNLNPTHYT